MEDIKNLQASVNYQKEMIEQLCWHVMGNKQHRIEGLYPKVEALGLQINSLEKEVHKLCEWRAGREKFRKTLITIAVWLGGFLVGFAGVASAVVAIWQQIR